MHGNPPSPSLTLVTGDRQLSSWSLRPWILLKSLGLPFEEIRVRLDTPAFERCIGSLSPTRKVPVLIAGSLTIWDSLAICEYASELVQGAGWPEDGEQRAHARAISAEMHSGFQALRRQWPLQSASRLDVQLDRHARSDVARIDAIWQSCLARGNPGPWLFGRYSIADAMYAPVVLRFNTYSAELSPRSRAYAATVLADPWIRQWMAEAASELEPARPAACGVPA